MKLRKYLLFIFISLSFLSCEDYKKVYIQEFIKENSDQQWIKEDFCGLSIFRRDTLVFVISDAKTNNSSTFVLNGNDSVSYTPGIDSIDLSYDSLLRFKSSINMFRESGARSVNFHCNEEVMYTTFGILEENFLVYTDSMTHRKFLKRSNYYTNNTSFKHLKNNWFLGVY